MAPDAAPLPRACPDCGAAMEAGHAVGYGGRGGGSIGWLPGTVVVHGRGFYDYQSVEPLIDTGFGFRLPRFPAWRCPACRVVTISYKDAVHILDPDAPPRSGGTPSSK